MFDFADDSSIFLADSPHTAIVGVNDPVPILFDEPAKSVDVYSGQIFHTAPACTMASSDVLANEVAAETIITIKDIDYSVLELLPDGAGLTRLLLTTDF